jgi:hypothetical protein
VPRDVANDWGCAPTGATVHGRSHIDVVIVDAALLVEAHPQH